MPSSERSSEPPDPNNLADLLRMDSNLMAEIGARVVRAGIRLSPARRAVLETLLVPGIHLSREEIALRLRDQSPRVSLSTVYRFTRMLVDLGIAREVRALGTSRFEITIGREDHDHLVCVQCGGIVEFRDSALEGLASHVAKAHGFSGTTTRLELRATCNACESSLTELQGAPPSATRTPERFAPGTTFRAVPRERLNAG